jgi:nicotinamide-nucleotide amidase
MTPLDAILISIGEELLIGQTINTNAAWIGQQLNHEGIAVKEVIVITDDQSDIIRTIRDAEKRSGLIIITGGLGPTRDDVTKIALCQMFGSSLIVDHAVLEDITEFFTRRGFPMTDLNRLQAMVPDNARVIRNPYGTAPGMWFEQDGKIVISMPGVPHEMKNMLTTYVIPELKQRIPTYHIIHKTVLTQGIGESFLAELISNWENNLPENIKLAYLPSPGFVKLRLSGRGSDKAFIEQAINDQVISLKTIIEQYIWGYDDQTLEGLTGTLLLSNHLSMATAESCTGGYIAHKITSIPGSSRYFKGSVVAYDNDIKSRILSVDQLLLDNYGAVSKEVVEAMAEGVRKLFKTDLSLAVSGIAGPGGGTDEKPVGMVWIACSSQDKTISKVFQFGGTRERNIILGSVAALAMFRSFAENHQQPG